MGQTDVCEQQGLLVLWDVVHHRQGLHDLRRALRDLRERGGGMGVRERGGGMGVRLLGFLRLRASKVV